MSINAVGVGSLNGDPLCQGPNSIRGLITRLHKSAFSLALDQLIDPGIVPRHTAIMRAPRRVTQSVLVSFQARDEEPRANMCTHAFPVRAHRALTQSHPRSSLRRGAADARLFVVSKRMYVSFRGPVKANLRQIGIRTLGIQTPRLTVYRCDRSDRTRNIERDGESVYQRSDYFGEFYSENKSEFYQN